ncbi:MAG: chitodextrinase, partial [Shewanella sp.]
MSNKTAYLGRHHSLALMVSTALLSQGVITNAYAIDCQGVAPWSADAIYASTAQVTQTNTLYQNKWWTTNESPTDSGDFGVWETVGACGGVANYPPVVTIESPLDMNTVNLGDLVVLSAQASDADGRVESLVWTINDTVITSPWTAEQ